MNLRLFSFISAMSMGLTCFSQDLGKYQLILDKQLLGIEKVTPSPETAPTTVVAEPSWSRDYRMTMITQDQDKLRVGLQSLKDQSAVLLIEGEDTYPDFRLISGNYQQGIARVSYRGSEYQFMIQSGPDKVSPAPSPTSIRNNGSNRPRGGDGASSRSGSPRIRSEESNPPAARANIPTRTFQSREELQAHLEAQQMDAIRTGKPPLPIPLTKQMDDQLVKEGVLAPQ